MIFPNVPRCFQNLSCGQRLRLGRIRLPGHKGINLAGLQQAKEIMALEIGVEDGEIVALSKGLNIRDYNIEVALMRLQKDTGLKLGARTE